MKKVVSEQSTESSSSDAADEKAVTIVKSSLEPTRGILRDKSPQRLQGGGSFGTTTETIIFSFNNITIFPEQKSDGEEEKKSVRFNLEDGAGVQIRLFEVKAGKNIDFPNIINCLLRRKIVKKRRVLSTNYKKKK